MTGPALQTVATADHLKAFLLDLNYEQGIDPTVAGLDAGGSPFLAMLRGPYADEDVVLFNTPWDGETYTTRGYRCNECAAQEPGKFADLGFPVIIIRFAS